MPADLLTRWGRPGGRRERDESNDDSDVESPTLDDGGTAIVCSGDDDDRVSIPVSDSATNTADVIPTNVTATPAGQGQRANTRVFYSPWRDRPDWDHDLFDSDAEWEEED